MIWVFRDLRHELWFVQCCSPGPSIFARLIFCFVWYSVLVLWSAFSPSLTCCSFDSHIVGWSLFCALNSKSVRRVLLYIVYSGVISPAPIDFARLCFPLHFSIICCARFASRPPILRVYSLVSVYLLAYFRNCFSKLWVYVYNTFLAFSAVISCVFLPSLSW